MAVVHPNSRLASTRSANKESPMYKTLGEARKPPPGESVPGSAVIDGDDHLRHFVSSRKQPSV